MLRPRFIDQMAMELGDRYAFTSLARGRRAFQPEHVEPKWPRDRVADIKHVRLEVALDFERKEIAGTAMHRMTAITSGVAMLEFDAAEMTVTAVRVGSVTASFDLDAGKLGVTLPAPLKAGEEIEVAIDYHARPRRGLYFVGPDEGYPNKPVQALTQGEDEDSRYWFPCYDYPNDRTTSEVIATVPEKFTAISNGALISNTHHSSAHTRTFHWRHDVPHSTYLITLAAGEFATVED